MWVNNISRKDSENLFPWIEIYTIILLGNCHFTIVKLALLVLLIYLCSYTEFSRLSTNCQVVTCDEVDMFLQWWQWNKFSGTVSFLKAPALEKDFSMNNFNVENLRFSWFHGSSYRFCLISSMMKSHVLTYKLLLDCLSQWHEYRHASCLCQVCKCSVAVVRIWTHQLCLMWHTPLTAMEKQCVSVRASIGPAWDVLTERESVRVWERVGSCSRLI